MRVVQLTLIYSNNHTGTKMYRYTNSTDEMHLKSIIIKKKSQTVTTIITTIILMIILILILKHFNI